ncbi:hypothetical protein T265_02132 [Opisthorchis viverrini]|uniref:Uncharacterized protein n=1 Tax=Opisthorchis viverrini TaxID=6198 RepID=A0A074ZVY6_OPIVI|nr:hypothetical protein T265_02132 [Opisthorchis viverrini]KER31618.1 hypothetical protein T265_02132 [Opisthorchis viverrini]
MSTRFDAASHFLNPSEPVVKVDRENTKVTHKSASKKNHTHFPVSDNPESDEGYNGSDEQDRLKGMPASFQHDEDELDYSLVYDVHSAEHREYDVLFRSRAGKRRRRPGREGAFHVERLDKTNVEESACSQASLFLRNTLFSRPTCKGVRRAEPELLISLAKKQKARRKRCNRDVEVGFEPRTFRSKAAVGSTIEENVDSPCSVDGVGLDNYKRFIINRGDTIRASLGSGGEQCQWCELTDLNVLVSNPTSTTRLLVSMFGQPGSISAFIPSSGGMTARNPNGVTAERLLLLMAFVMPISVRIV